MTRTRRSNCANPGISRRRRGRGFAYLDPAGDALTDPDDKMRIDALVLPPAWTDVWICPDPRGHIQATGVDAKGRLQYRYHDDWRRQRDLEKFDHMLEFARALPKIRHFTGEHLAIADMSEERVLACAVELLDIGFFRIGGESYAAENGSYGLATIERRHARVVGDCVTFDYVAKGSKRRIQSIVSPEIAEVVRALKRRRGGLPELLAYKRGARWVDVKSADINAYLRSISGGDYSAKDFRTWNATVRASAFLSVVAADHLADSGKRRAVSHCFREVAHYLGNTPAVCRSSYVDPRVVDHFMAGTTARIPSDRLVERDTVERAVLALLDDT